MVLALGLECQSVLQNLSIVATACGYILTARPLRLCPRQYHALRRSSRAGKMGRRHTYIQKRNYPIIRCQQVPIERPLLPLLNGRFRHLSVLSPPRRRKNEKDQPSRSSVCRCRSLPKETLTLKKPECRFVLYIVIPLQILSNARGQGGKGRWKAWFVLLPFWRLYRNYRARSILILFRAPLVLG